MKCRMLSVLLCLLLLPGVLALADDSAEDVIALPEAVAAFFDGDAAWSGWTPVAADEYTRDGDPRWIAAVVLEREGLRALCLLKRNGPDGSYAWADAATRVVRQQGDLPEIRIEPGVYDEPEYSPVVSLTYYNGESGAVTYGWNEVNGLWSIGGMQMQETYGEVVRHNVTLSVFRMYLEYNEWIGTGDETGGTIMQTYNRKYGKISRMLGNFDIETLPISWAQAAESDIGDPQRPAPGAQLDPLADGEKEQIVQTTPVRLGPDGSYARVEDFVVTPETDVQSIALYANYALIAYREEDASPWRYGYVPVNAFAQQVRAPQNGFAYTRAYVLENVTLTDCPEGESALLTLEAGEEAVYLATLGGNWTRVAVEKDGVRAHGFVRSDALLIDYDMDVSMGGSFFGGTEAVVVTDSMVVHDPFRRAQSQTIATVSRGDVVQYMDRLYNGYAYVGVETDDGPVVGFIEYWRLAPVDGVKLESNG